MVKLLVDFLDMIPTSIATTDIKGILIVRKATKLACPVSLQVKSG